MNKIIFECEHPSEIGERDAVSDENASCIKNEECQKEEAREEND